VGAAATSFRQAGANSLPPVPAGVGGASVQPLGSVLIRAEMAATGTAILFDCRPGSGEGKATPAPATASPFETVAIDPGATPQPAPRATPAVALRSSALKAAGRRVKIAIACTAADCTGSVTLKAGSRTLAPKRAYTVKSGARRTVTLTLSQSARKLLKDKKSLKVTVRVTAAGGKTLTKKLTLR
jgi:hypothetical protein